MKAKPSLGTPGVQSVPEHPREAHAQVCAACRPSPPRVSWLEACVLNDHTLILSLHLPFFLFLNY